MELRQLRYFAKIVECQSFSEASRQLHITQSTLSQQTRQLEEELGVQLLRRSSHSVEMTDVGEAFLPQALRALEEAEACKESIAEVMQCLRGTLNIGVTYTFSPILKEAILLFMKAHPRIRLKIVSHSMAELMDKLLRREIDLALAYKPSQGYEQVESHFLFDNELCVVVAENHPLATRSGISLYDLQHHRMALPAVGLQARAKFDDMNQNKDLDFNVCLELNDVHELIDLVRDSRLVTVLSTATIAQERGVVGIPFEGADSMMEGSYHLLKGEYTKVATREFLRILCECKHYGMAKMDLY